MIEKFKIGEIVKYIANSSYYENKYIRIVEINKKNNCYYAKILNSSISFYVFVNEIRKLKEEDKLELL